MRTAVGPAAEGVVEVEVDDEITLYAPQTDQVLVLNSTAADVWRLCDGTLELDALVRVLADAYDVEAGGILPDVQRTVEAFAAAGLLRRGPAS